MAEKARTKEKLYAELNSYEIDNEKKLLTDARNKTHKFDKTKGNPKAIKENKQQSDGR